jgi:hypothetical protein
LRRVLSTERAVDRLASRQPDGYVPFTRNGIAWTRRFKKIADDAFLINASSADQFFKCPTCSPMALRMVAAIAAGSLASRMLRRRVKGQRTLPPFSRSRL